MTTPASLDLDDAQWTHANAMVGVVYGKGLPERAAVIVIETGIIESNLRIYANIDVPDSLNIPHDNVGSDHLSVGILQQQVPSWGTAADCMDPARSAGKFLEGAGNNPGLLNLPGYRFSYVGYPNATSWTQLPTGSAAQAVQVSAFPTRYQSVEGWATRIVDASWTNHIADSINTHLEDTMQPFFLRATDGDQAIWLVGAPGTNGPIQLTPTEAALQAALWGIPNSAARRYSSTRCRAVVAMLCRLGGKR